MKKEFELRMKHQFPLLYRDMWGHARRTCMAFGLDVGDGWAELIEDVSAKLEPKIKEMKEEIEKSPNLKCENCLRPRSWHWWFVLVDYLRKWFYILTHWLPSIPKNYREEKANVKRLGAYGFKFKWSRVLRLPYRGMCCTGFRVPYPCASQVKEKFAGLRLYMSYYNEELERIISEAENKSYTICERCGADGEVRDGGWIKALCDKCSKERK
jgi:hypothetical protein